MEIYCTVNYHNPAMEIYCTACELSYLRLQYECIKTLQKGRVRVGITEQRKIKTDEVEVYSEYIYIYIFLPEYETFLSAPCLVHDTKNNCTVQFNARQMVSMTYNITSYIHTYTCILLSI